MISVIVPIYNVADYLDDCVQSILNSTYKDLEIILVDDGSTDNSGRICEKYATIDRRCKVYHIQNGGLSAARNYGLEHSSGDYISFVDGDDFIHPQMYDILYRSLSENPDADFSFCPFYYYRVGDAFNFGKIQDSSSVTQTIMRNQMVNQMFGNWKNNCMLYIVVWNKLYRRNLLQGLTFSECAMSEDLIFSTEISIRMKHAILVNTPLYYYVQRSGSILHQGITKNFIKRIDVYDRCYKLLKAWTPDLCSICLQKCIKTVLNVLCETRNTELYGYAKVYSKPYINTYRKELLKSSLPLMRKISVIIISYFPHLYQKIALNVASLSFHK